MRLPFSKHGLKLAMLNAERYAERNVQRHITAKKVEVPERWKQQAESVPALPAAVVDFEALIRQVRIRHPMPGGLA